MSLPGRINNSRRQNIVRSSVRVTVTISVALAAFFVPASASAMWVHWGDGSAHSYRSFRQTVELGVAGRDTFWASQFFFTGDRTSGGYVGVQNDGFAFELGQGQTAIFSLWNALRAVPAPGATCGRFDGEGEGLSCRTRIAFSGGDRYRVRVARAAYSLHWTEFSASVVNLTTKVTYRLGTIRVSGAELLQAPSNFIEYFGDSSKQCSRRPAASARFFPPVVEFTETATRILTLQYRGSADPMCAQENAVFSRPVAVVQTGS
jgi:hypothetical protein